MLTVTTRATGIPVNRVLHAVRIPMIAACGLSTAEAPRTLVSFSHRLGGLGCLVFGREAIEEFIFGRKIGIEPLIFSGAIARLLTRP